RTAASVAYRLGFAAWIARTRGRGIALARRKRHAAWAVSTFGARFRLVLEVHEVDSRQAADPADAAAAHALEATVLRAAWGVIANADGTLSELRDAHRRLPPARVIHNAARPGAVPAADSHGVGVVGAVRPYKDPQTVAAAAAQLDQPVTWVGATVADGLGDVVVEAPVPYRDVPARIGRFRTLVVPLSPGLFGERLTSPLKLWDALASGIPVVAADTPAIRAAAGDAFLPYVPGDPASLARAITLASTDPAVRASLIARARGRARTWDQRASEVEAFLAETAGSR
ncbi:MAG: glycosyltransferase, partial [Myxococcota bacterium]